MRNHKLLKPLPGELEHSIKYGCNQGWTLGDIANTLQDVRKGKNIGRYSLYKTKSFKDKPPLRVENKEKPRERVAEVTKKENSCHNCGSKDHHYKQFPKERKKLYSIEKVPEEETPAEDYESDSMGDSIREKSDEDQDPEEETQLEIQDIKFEAGLKQETKNKNLCKNTQDAQNFLVAPTKGMHYIHGTAAKITVFIDNDQHPLLIESGAHISIVSREYMYKNFPNWGKKLFPTKEKNFKSTSGKMTSIETTIKEIIIHHRKGNIRIKPELVVLKDAQIQGFLLGTDYQRIHGIDIYNSENRHITIGTNKEK
ncbi:hypothetical protein O181_025404 [Austropuccinia psidii MF-1]|uniref:Uncharacterized protein n=1 Tax=Austropuccinia psidii MF-1 TaxID=1389203 RepID=A0A9Q3CKH5_9BASI|nr:hypothetical protein [Austropuccinia psidii MF-1]